MFEVTEQHILLLRRAFTSWEDCEFGAPAIDCKRPYGNSSVLADMAEILGLPSLRSDDFVISEAEEDRLNQLHKETETALQIFLRTGEMRAGTYVSDRYMRNWRAA